MVETLARSITPNLSGRLPDGIRPKSNLKGPDLGLYPKHNSHQQQLSPRPPSNNYRS